MSKLVAREVDEVLARLRTRLAETWKRRRVEILRDALGEANGWRVTEKEKGNERLH